jgi:hypothetical protein
MEQEQMMNSNDDDSEMTIDDVSTQHRGSKSFIEQMNRIESEQITEDNIFETEEQGE